MGDVLINTALLSFANLFMIYGIGATAHTGNKWWLVCLPISMMFYLIYALERKTAPKEKKQ